MRAIFYRKDGTKTERSVIYKEHADEILRREDFAGFVLPGTRETDLAPRFFARCLGGSRQTNRGTFHQIIRSRFNPGVRG